MMSKAKYKSEASEAIHLSAQALLRTGAIDKITMREFDVACLTPIPDLSPAQIRKLRRSVKVSQPIFANHLGTSSSTVEKWETGAKKPSKMALKLMSLVQKHGLEILA